MFGILPADEFQLFDAPTLVSKTTVANTIVPLIGSDPTRTVLIISGQVTSPVFLAPAGMGGNVKGVMLGTGGNPTLMLYYNDYGALVQCGWECFCTVAGIALSVISLSVSRPPSLSGWDIFPERVGKGITPQALAPAPARKTVRRAPLPIGVKRLLAQRCPHLYPGDE